MSPSGNYHTGGGRDEVYSIIPYYENMISQLFIKCLLSKREGEVKVKCVFFMIVCVDLSSISVDISAEGIVCCEIK